MRTGYLSKRDSEMLKMRFKKRVAFVPSLFPKHIIKTRFGILKKVGFAVSSNPVCLGILFKIVTLIFPPRLRVCNAIYVEYRVVSNRVVVTYILRVLWKRGMIIAFSNAAENKNANLESAMQRYFIRRHDCTQWDTRIIYILCKFNDNKYLIYNLHAVIYIFQLSKITSSCHSHIIINEVNDHFVTFCIFQPKQNINSAR